MSRVFKSPSTSDKGMVDLERGVSASSGQPSSSRRGWPNLFRMGSRTHDVPTEAKAPQKQDTSKEEPPFSFSSDSCQGESNGGEAPTVLGRTSSHEPRRNFLPMGLLSRIASANLMRTSSLAHTDTFQSQKNSTIQHVTVSSIPQVASNGLDVSDRSSSSESRREPPTDRQDTAYNNEQRIYPWRSSILSTNPCTSDSCDSDNSSIGSLVTEDDGMKLGHIAIGIPQDGDSIHSNDEDINIPRDSMEAMQRDLSRLVAEGLAREEHAAKLAGRITSPSSETTVSPMSPKSIKSAIPFDDCSPEMLVEAARRASHASQGRRSDTSQSSTRTGLSRLEMDVQNKLGRRAGPTVTLRRSNAQVSTKSHVSLSIPESGHSNATRARRSSNTCSGIQKSRDGGPSLASTYDDDRPGVSYVMESSYHHQTKTKSEKSRLDRSGPSLAPSTRGEDGTFVHHWRSSHASSRLAYAEDESDSNYSDEEDSHQGTVQVGVPVVGPSPGAYSVHFGRAQSSNYTVDASDTDSVDSEEHNPETEIPSNEPAAHLQAELHVPVVAPVVDAAVVEDEEELEIDPKVVRRLRLVQIATFCFSCAAIAMVAASIVRGLSKAESGDYIPQIEGWNQVGADIFGLADDKQVFMGYDVKLSESGKRLAIAAPGVDGKQGRNFGQVVIMQEESSEWILHSTIEGTVASDEAQTKLAMSSDGNRLIIGFPHAGSGKALFYRYDERDAKWVLESSVFGNESDKRVGQAVAILADGSIAAVGGHGVVRIYQRIGSTWTMLGSELFGARNQNFGSSVSLGGASNGFRIAIGAPEVTEAVSGLVHVFDWNGSSWQPFGDPLAGEIRFYGQSLSMSVNGTMLAIGGRGDSGLVRVFREMEGGWKQMGADLSGEEIGEGYAVVDLSSDGHTVAVGGPQHSEFGDSSGRIQVLTFDESAWMWKQEGSNIGGLEGSNFGFSVSISGDGSRVGGGAPETTVDRSLPQAGSVRVFDRET